MMAYRYGAIFGVYSNSYIEQKHRAKYAKLVNFHFRACESKPRSKNPDASPFKQSLVQKHKITIPEYAAYVPKMRSYTHLAGFYLIRVPLVDEPK